MNVNYVLSYYKIEEHSVKKLIELSKVRLARWILVRKEFHMVGGNRIFRARSEVVV